MPRVRVATPLTRQMLRVADASGLRRFTLFGLQGRLRVVALGLPPEADESTLRSELDTHGMEDVDLVVTLVVGGTGYLPDE